MTTLVAAAWMLVAAGCRSTAPESAGAGVVLDGVQKRVEKEPASGESATEREPLIALASDEDATASAADFLREAGLAEAAERKARQDERNRLFAELLEVDGEIDGETDGETDGESDTLHDARNAARERPGAGDADGASDELDDVRARLARAVERLEGGGGDTSELGADGSEAGEGLRSGGNTEAAEATEKAPGSDEPAPAAKPVPPPQVGEQTPAEDQEQSPAVAASEAEAAAAATAPPPIQRPQGHEQIVELPHKSGAPGGGIVNVSRPYPAPRGTGPGGSPPATPHRTR
ncbi:MAG: hypothetical protein O7J95_03815 [Planctomycetota bacterium]|nr:hypothetical protein [Planctomycetota bacterium]